MQKFWTTTTEILAVAGAYTNGDTIGEVSIISDAVLNNYKSGKIIGATVVNTTTAMDLYLFEGSFLTGTTDDHDSFNPSTTDNKNMIISFKSGESITLANKVSYFQCVSPSAYFPTEIPFVSTTGNLCLVAVASGTPDFTGDLTIQVKLHFLIDY